MCFHFLAFSFEIVMILQNYSSLYIMIAFNVEKCFLYLM